MDLKSKAKKFNTIIECDFVRFNMLWTEIFANNKKDVSRFIDYYLSCNDKGENFCEKILFLLISSYSHQQHQANDFFLSLPPKLHTDIVDYIGERTGVQLTLENKIINPYIMTEERFNKIISVVPTDQNFFNFKTKLSLIFDSTQAYREILYKHLDGLYHSISCVNQSCEISLCQSMQEVLSHLKQCDRSLNCTYQDCLLAHKVLSHREKCVSSSCDICFPNLEKYYGS